MAVFYVLINALSLFEVNRMVFRLQLAIDSYSLSYNQAYLIYEV